MPLPQIPGPDNTYSYNSGYGKQDFIEVTVTFGEPVIVSGVPELPLEVGAERRRAAYHSGSGTTSLVFRYELTEGETDSDGVMVPSSGDISKLTGPGLVRYASTKAVAPARLWDSVRTDYLVDAVRPTLVRANALANGNDVTLAWDKALDEDSAPTATGTAFFRVKDTSDDTSRQITAISVLGRVVTLTLSSAVSATDRLTVSYEDPFASTPESVLMQVQDVHKPLKDTLGNHARKDNAAISITQSANSPSEFPSIETGARSVNENTSAGRIIGTPIAATDADNDRRTYSISGTDAAFFDMVASSGQLRTKAALNHESRDSYSFTMSVTDGKNVHGYADTTVDDTISVTVTVEDVDEPPVKSPWSYYDKPTTTKIAPATWPPTPPCDPEGDSNITWSLGGTDQADFDITWGVLTFQNVPDYERTADSGGNNHYEVTVQATDSNNKRGELHVDVIVTDVDEPPIIDGPDTVDDFPENSATSRQVGRYTASDPEGASVNLNLSSGSADFSLAGNGVLTFEVSPDFEDQRSYSVTVRAEAGPHSTDKVVTINIQNLEEPGAITLSSVQPQEGTAFTATLDDDDGPTGTIWQWYRTSSQGSTGTAITNANSRSYSPVAADVGRYLRAIASYDDGHGTGKTAIAVSANRVQEAPPTPEPPVFPVDGDYHRSIRENLRAGSNVGAPVTATDGNNDRLTYSIAASDEFEIVESTGQLCTKAELDREGREQHFVTVTATDPGGLADTISVTITVEDVDETPVVSGPSSLEFKEGTNTGTTLATYSSTDPDLKGIDLVLSGADGEDFALSNGGVLAFNEVPNFEEPADSNRDNRYQFTVEAREQGDGASVGRLNVAIRVTNVDEPGMLHTNAEEPRVGQTVRLNVEDEDGGINVTEWKWERGEPNNSSCGTFDSPTVTAWTTISGARSSSYTPTAADQGHCIRATAFYDDRAGTGRTEQFLTTSSVVIGPFFTQAPPTYRVQENTAQGRNIGRVQARHSNSGEALTYGLSGADAGYFTLDNNGQLKTSATPLDYETQPGQEAAVEITAEDNSGQTVTITVTVTVTNECASAGEPPCAPSRPGVSSTSDTSLRVTWSAPRTPTGTSITAYDLQYRESDGGGSWIPQSVAGTDRSHTIENLIKDTTYEVQVRASNDNSAYGEWSESGTGRPGFTEGRGGGGGGGGGGGAPANREPVFADGHRTTRRAPENTPVGDSCGDPVTATDADNDTLTYSLRGDDASSFTVDPRTGQLHAKAPLDYETRANYRLEVRVTDGKGGDDSIDVTVSVTNVNEPPLISGPDTYEYEENGEDSVATYTAADPEGGDVVVWALVGDDAGLFTVSNAGALAFNDPPDYEGPLDVDEDNVYRVTLQATDASDITGTLDVAVTVTDADDVGIVRRYDLNKNGLIDRREALAAVSDYFADLITKSEAVEVITHYFVG